ncbi:DNA (cytosine-5)-methyltransferase 1 [Rhizobium lusitanum]|uniref:DNA (Cytosine-5)-methyltransferase 1 n=1 Tax=Rhizobium lusitanum TaxID=293958 RepID=A0A1C3VS82_9HYPH|nr:DNA (cytosine-5)-methyltransferase 1 [Rhizobium lusitanum]
MWLYVPHLSTSSPSAPGGAGLDLGVELAIQSARTVCMVEREGFSCAQLVSAMEAGHLAPAAIWSDARTFNGRAWRGAVDGLIGGIPCQPHSLAGKRLGEEDDRDLWSTARRIIVQSGAWFVLIENVRGILSSGGAERVWRDLRRLGFQVEGGLFTAAEVGASHERERFFILAVSGVGLADPYGERLEGERADVGTIGRPYARRSARLRDGTALVDTESLGCREGRPEPEFRSGRPAVAISGGSVGNASGLIGADVIDRAGEARQRVVALDRTAGGNGHGRSAEGDLSRQRKDAAQTWVQPLFAPGPADLSSWSNTLASAPELEPAFRRVADGLASRLDIARVDRLRMLGNGVVPLQAAYALRTLVTRLAARGSSGAVELVRLMEIAA